MKSSTVVSEALSASLRGARVLIVDDDRIQCEMMAKLLREWGVTPGTAMTLSDALRLFREMRPELVLLDVMMPQVDGYKLAQTFKRDRSFVPIIMLTALEDIESKRRSLAAGADEFLTKPVNGVELQIRMSSMLRIRRLADELEKANKSLAALATVDSLTGVANRRLLEQRLTEEFRRTKRYERPLSLIMLDVDHFKKVNDVHGHPIGDRVLSLIGSILRQCTRATDLVGRFGGEEFMVIAPETSGDAVTTLAERIRTLVAAQTAEPDAETQGIPPVTVSLGVATTRDAAETQEGIVKRADDALYRAKREGRNRVVVAE